MRSRSSKNAVSGGGNQDSYDIDDPKDGPMEFLSGLASKVGFAAFVLIPPTVAVYFFRDSGLGLGLWLGVIAYLATCLGIAFYAKDRLSNQDRLDLSLSADSAIHDEVGEVRSTTEVEVPAVIDPLNIESESQHVDPRREQRMVEKPFLPSPEPIPSKPLEPPLDLSRITNQAAPVHEGRAGNGDSGGHARGHLEGSPGQLFSPGAGGFPEHTAFSAMRQGRYGSPAGNAELSFSVRTAKSHYEKFPHGLRVTIKTNVEISPVHLKVECNGPISKAEVGLTRGGKILGLRWLITGNIYDVAFARPSLTPDDPLVITLYSTREIKAIQVLPAAD